MPIIIDIQPDFIVKPVLTGSPIRDEHYPVTKPNHCTT